MRVISESKWELIAAHRPHWLSLLFVCAGMAMAAGAMTLRSPPGVAQTVGMAASALFFVFSAYRVSTTSEFRFDATSRKVKWVERRPFGKSSGAIDFSELKGVSVQTQDESCRVILQTAAGDTPLTRHYSTVEPHTETARRIAAWLRAHGVDVA